jgi:hypothetical protein
MLSLICLILCYTVQYSSLLLPARYSLSDNWIKVQLFASVCVIMRGEVDVYLLNKLCNDEILLTQFTRYEMITI